MTQANKMINETYLTAVAVVAALQRYYDLMVLLYPYTTKSAIIFIITLRYRHHSLGVGLVDTAEADVIWIYRSTERTAS